MIVKIARVQSGVVILKQEKPTRWITVQGKRIPITAPRGRQPRVEQEPSVPQLLSPLLEGVTSSVLEEVQYHLEDELDMASHEESSRETKAKVAVVLSDRLAGNAAWEGFLASELGYEIIEEGMEIDQPSLGHTTHYRRGSWSAEAESEAAVAGLIRNWALTSGDSNDWAIALQLAVYAEFHEGLPVVPALGHFRSATMTQAQDMFEQGGADGYSPEAGLRAFVRTMYDETQEWLEEHDIKELILYRGANFVESEGGFPYNQSTRVYDIETQPMSAFSANLLTAWTFAEDEEERPYRMVIAARVPKERILSTCQTGFGCKNEAEAVVLGGKDRMTALTWKSGGAFYAPVFRSISDMRSKLARELTFIPEPKIQLPSAGKG